MEFGFVFIKKMNSTFLFRFYPKENYEEFNVPITCRNEIEGI